MLYSLFVLSGLAAVCGFGSLPSSSGGEAGMSLGTESAKTSFAPTTYAPHQAKDGPRAIMTVSSHKQCYKLDNFKHCEDAWKKDFLGSGFCGERKTEATCGHGNEVYRQGSNAAFDLCGWAADPNHPMGGKCKLCGVSFKCHPICTQEWVQMTELDPATGVRSVRQSTLDWPSPPPPPSPSPPARRKLDVNFDEDEVTVNADLEEEEMNADIRRQLANKLGRNMKLPPGARFGQCDSCPEDLSTTDSSEDGYSEKAAQCAPGVNGLFYDLEINKNTTHGIPADARGVPYGSFRVTTQSCDMGTLYYCTEMDIPSDPSDPTKGPCPLGSIAGETVFKDLSGNPIGAPIEGDKLLEVKNLKHTDPDGTTYMIDKFVRTSFSISVFGNAWEYHPVRASTQCKCARSFTPDALNDLDEDGNMRAGRSPPANADDVRAGRATSDFGLKQCKVMSNAATDPRAVARTPKTKKNRFGLSYISCKVARTAPNIDAVEQCLPSGDDVIDITIASRTIGTKRGNLMKSMMKCGISIFDSNPGAYAGRIKEEQDADCLCKKPSSVEDLNFGTFTPDTGARSGEELIKGDCFEVLPIIW